MNNKRVLLTIMDGWGYGEENSTNAIYIANTPNFDHITKTYPNTKIYADGEHVGLPDGQMGNSEVGHLNLGAGRIVFQELTRINNAIKTGELFKNEQFLKAIDHVKANDSSIHLVGLVSDGGVHSSMDHLFALIDLAKEKGLKKVYVHALLDGRDTPPKSAVGYVAQVNKKLSECGLSQVASVIGRYYAMDRDQRWDRVEKAYNCLISGEGEKAASGEVGIENCYKNDITDEFVLPTIVDGAQSRISDNDAVIFFNFRPDRAREITKAINGKDFDGFDRKKVVNNLYYICMTQYDETFNMPIAYPPQEFKQILGDVLESNGIKQYRTAETEKYAHVTFFFNGGVEKPYPGETRVLVNSPKVATYDLQPEMSAPEVTEKVIEAVKNNKYQFILVNFANPDMVGHTGVKEAAVKAIETIDDTLGQILKAVKEENVTMLLTADHGNAEKMIDCETNQPFTAHTTNMVPFAVINYDKEIKLQEGGKLADVAPTVLDIMEIEKPEEMTGLSLLSKVGMTSK